MDYPFGEIRVLNYIPFPLIDTEKGSIPNGGPGRHPVPADLLPSLQIEVFRNARDEIFTYNIQIFQNAQAGNLHG
ncbi:MAG: hypothetical protein CVV30_03790 [Methanomicrobiales archaeon HGW-Methanomicrobiales-1]|jgi:hypothetical protein|nr:MAG: hypothetical protein CVV30_03790 [Methanomicrobiales archaeon HGW-Methanomicrobiales-1]